MILQVKEILNYIKLKKVALTFLQSERKLIFVHVTLIFNYSFSFLIMQAYDVEVYPIVDKVCSGVYSSKDGLQVMFFVHSVALKEVLLMIGMCFTVIAYGIRT